jgi:hypothetical protein
MFRFPSVTITKNGCSDDSSATKSLIESSPPSKQQQHVATTMTGGRNNKQDCVAMVAPFVHQSMPNIAQQDAAVETHHHHSSPSPSPLARFNKTGNLPDSRASSVVGCGSQNELPGVQDMLALKMVPRVGVSEYTNSNVLQIMGFKRLNYGQDEDEKSS